MLNHYWLSSSNNNSRQIQRNQYKSKKKKLWYTRIKPGFNVGRHFVTFRGVCETVDWFDHGDRRPTLSFCIGYAQSSTHGYVQKYLCMSQRKYHRLCLLLLQTQNVVVVGTPRWQWVPLIPPMGSVRTPIWASKYLKTPKTFAGCTSFLLTYPS